MISVQTSVQSLFENAEPLFGRPVGDTNVQALLSSLGHWPPPQFSEDEFIIYVEDKPHGYCLKLDEASTVKNPIVAGIPEGTPVLVGCFFFSEGVDGYRQFSGRLPRDILWSDGPETVLKKVGAPKFEFKNKTTGVLSTHRWDCGAWHLTVKYRDDGKSVRHINADLRLVLNPK